MAGNDDVLQEARVLGDRLVRLKAEAPDYALADALLTPQMKAARSEYGTFMKNNANLPIDENILNNFYTENPTVRSLLNKAKRENPQAFKNVKSGTLAELEELKRLLKGAAKRQGEEVPKAEGYKAARQQLKDIIEGYVPGFREMNMRYADAKLTQQMYEDAIKSGASTVGGVTKSPFISKWGSALSGGLLTGGIMSGSPATIGALAAGIGGRALHRAIQRAQGRALMDGTTLSAEVLRNTLNGGNSIFQNIKYPVGAEYLNNYRSLRNNNPLNAY